MKACRTQGVSDKLAGVLADIAKAVSMLQTPVSDAAKG